LESTSSFAAISTSAQDIARVMDGAKAKLCWTDPSWNVAYGSAHTQAKHSQIANDDLGDKFPEFCRAFCKGIASVTLPGSLLYLAMSAQEWPTIHGALSAAGFHWSSTIIWAKDSLVLSRKDCSRGCRIRHARLAFDIDRRDEPRPVRPKWTTDRAERLPESEKGMSSAHTLFGPTVLARRSTRPSWTTRTARATPPLRCRQAPAERLGPGLGRPRFEASTSMNRATKNVGRSASSWARPLPGEPARPRIAAAAPALRARQRGQRGGAGACRGDERGSTRVIDAIGWNQGCSSV
jgi:hypothetical protein